MNYTIKKLTSQHVIFEPTCASCTGVKTPRQCLVDTDFYFNDFQLIVGLIDSTLIVWLIK